MENKPLVSILIPCYNSETYVEETLNSCIQQTCKVIEIIVVDDHSSDKSFEVVSNFQARYPGVVKLFKNPKKGACAARNYAFEVSTGEYIQFLDADDLLSSNKIESQLELFSSCSQNSISSCQWGRFYHSLADVTWENQLINKDYKEPKNWLIDSWNGLGMAQTSVWLTPRQLIEKAGGWNEDLLINQDGEFFSRVLLFAEEIKYCSEAKVFYRSGNENSVSQSGKMGYDKAASLLNSYILYQKNLLAEYDGTAFREALGMNYLNFIYQFVSSHPDLVTIARENYFSLGFKKMKAVGGDKFIKVAKIFGFRTALILKKVLRL